MEAKDLVMSYEQINCLCYDTGGKVLNLENWSNAVAKAQAEISFPAGEKQGIEKGRKEVVEWVKQNHWHSADGHLEGDGINDKKWQAKLKEWEIK